MLNDIKLHKIHDLSETVDDGKSEEEAKKAADEFFKEAMKILES